jgi:hypothetical protein
MPRYHVLVTHAVAYAGELSDEPFEGGHRSLRSYDLCADDRLIDCGWQRRTARSVLGVDPLVLAAGHSPMLSRPEAVADAIATPGDARWRSGGHADRRSTGERLP